MATPTWQILAQLDHLYELQGLNQYEDRLETGPTEPPLPSSESYVPVPTAP